MHSVSGQAGIAAPVSTAPQLSADVQEDLTKVKENQLLVG